jgi:XTP/dITP diphosphohydrolase
VRDSAQGQRELVLATTNRAKAERLRWVFEGLGFRLRSLPPDATDGPEENGASFRENAMIKACYWSRRLGALAAASDGGLAIPALGSRWNALRTARAAGPNADDETKARHLLELTRGLKGEQRRVHWSEGLAIADNGALLASWEAAGTTALLLESLEEARIRPGFWAASLCYLPDRRRTLAELSEAELEEIDLTWTRLRTAVRAWAASRQSDSR